jgi:hypothetical protein
VMAGAMTRREAWQIIFDELRLKPIKLAVR